MDEIVEKFLHIYELIINEEHHYDKIYQTHVSFYISIITALIAGLIAGIFQASERNHFAFLLFGFIFILIISQIAISSTSRSYKRILEVITMRAKIEKELDLVNPRPSNASDSYWPSESIIPTTNINDRKKYVSSKAFVDDKLKQGYHIWTKRLFRMFQGFSIIMICIILIILYNFLIVSICQHIA